jgi:ADP-heptose:LPS heptosyltransferase
MELLCYRAERSEAMAILVSHAGALGDFITTLPSICVWRRLHARETTFLLGRPAFAALGGGMFDEVWDAGSGRFASLYGPAPDARLADQFSSFVSVLLFTSRASPLAANLAALGVREITNQEPFPRGPSHVVDYHLSLFPAEVVTEADRIPRIAPPDDPEAARAVEPGTIAIHPGSGSARKNWPLARFLELARRLEARGGRIVWIEGPAERGGIPDAQVWRELSLPALGARLSRCALFVGNDSGISHLAAAVGCPSVVLFGATSPAVWAPRGERVQIVDSGGKGLERISVERALHAARNLLGE